MKDGEATLKLEFVDLATEPESGPVFSNEWAAQVARTRKAGGVILMRRVLGLALAVGLVAASAPTARGESMPTAAWPWQPRPLSRPIYAVPDPEAPDGSFVVVGAGGVELYSDFWLPRAKPGGARPPRRVPTVISFTPYELPGTLDSEALRAMLPVLVSRGYAFVVSHVRGTGASGGCLQIRGPREIEDMGRVIEWIATKSAWSTRELASYGLSYFGGTGLGFAMRGKSEQRKYLKAVVAIGPFSSLYDRLGQDGVNFFLVHELFNVDYMRQTTFSQVRSADQIAPRAGCLPENALAGLDTSGNVTAWYRERDDRVAVRNLRAATLMVQGHADNIVLPIVQTGLFDRMPRSTPKAGLFASVGHEDLAPPSSSELPESLYRADYLDIVVAWLDRYVKGLPTGAEAWPVAQVQGNDGLWRAEPDWPSTGGRVGQLALGPAGALGTRAPDGEITYTEGGFDTTIMERPPGTFARFETAPLPQRLEITGMPVLDLWVRLDRPDAHVAVAVETFGPDGEPLGHRGHDIYYGAPVDTGMAWGLRSARHLEPLVGGRFWQAEETAPAVGSPVRIQVRIQPTDLVIPRGGTVRVTVSGSTRVQPGVEAFSTGVTGEPLPSTLDDPSSLSGSATRVTILHDCEHPSALRFLMPRKRPALLNVRELGETGPLRAMKGPVPVSDAGGLATAPVCGKAPIRLPMFGPPIRY